MKKLAHHVRVLHLNGLERPKCSVCGETMVLRAARKSGHLFFGCPRWNSNPNSKRSCKSVFDFEDWANQHALKVYEKALAQFVNYGAMEATVTYNAPLVSMRPATARSTRDLTTFSRQFNRVITEKDYP